MNKYPVPVLIIRFIPPVEVVYISSSSFTPCSILLFLCQAVPWWVSTSTRSLLDLLSKQGQLKMTNSSPCCYTYIAYQQRVSYGANRLEWCFHFLSKFISFIYFHVYTKIWAANVLKSPHLHYHGPIIMSFNTTS